MVKLLIEHGGDVKAVDEKQRTALHYAVWRNPSLDVIRVLVEAGAVVDAHDDVRFTPLHYAASQNPSTVKILISFGAKVNHLNKMGWSTLFMAASWNQREAVIALCNAGADPRLGVSPLGLMSGITYDMQRLIRQQLSIDSSCPLQ